MTLSELLSGRMFNVRKATDVTDPVRHQTRFIRLEVSGPKFSENQDWEFVQNLISQVRGIQFDDFWYNGESNIYLFEVDKGLVIDRTVQRVRVVMPCREKRDDVSEPSVA